MSSSDQQMELYSAAQAAIEPFTAGGVIDRAIGDRVGSMDGLVGAHLDTVARLNGRGDEAPERPTYVFNPASQLLIKYSAHRDSDPTREGLFADVVELDEQGKPRHGVSEGNPFDSSQGFIPVAVGESNRNFTPSSFEFQVDDEGGGFNPPNIEMADLALMLKAEPIDEDVALEDFVAEKAAEDTEAHQRVFTRLGAANMRNEQAISDRTNRNLHLVVTDRDDTSVIEEVSRELGLFPIIMDAEGVLAGLARAKDFGLQPEDYQRHLQTYIPSGRPDVHSTLTKHTPAFLTVDFQEMRSSDPATFDRGQKARQALGLDISLFGKGPLKNNPAFRQLINLGYAVDEEYPEVVEKDAHGEYRLAMDPSLPENVQTYTDWLRKAKLDYALTLYLRGVAAQ